MQGQLFENQQARQQHRDALKAAAVALNEAYPNMMQKEIATRIGVNPKQVSRFLIEHAQQKARQTPQCDTASARLMGASTAAGTSVQTASIISHREIAASFEKAAARMTHAAKSMEAPVAELRIAAQSLEQAAQNLDGLLRDAFVQGINTQRSADSKLAETGGEQ